MIKKHYIKYLLELDTHNGHILQAIYEVAKSESSTQEYAKIFYLMDKRLQEIFIVGPSNPIVHAKTVKF